MTDDWKPGPAESAARTQALVLALLGTAGWVWFGYALNGMDADGGTVPVAASLALAVTMTVFSAALTVVAWVVSVGGRAVARVDLDARARAAAGDA